MRISTNLASATVDLANGGRLSSLVVAGHELLVTAASGGPHGTFFWGSYPMAPWVGRTLDAGFTFDGETHRLEANAPPHAMHGTVYDAVWTQVGDAVIEADLGDRWPFPGFARQRFHLTDHDFTQTLELHATERPMPGSVGWHPWFRRSVGGADVDLSIDTDPAGVFSELGEPLPGVPPQPWDHFFAGVPWPVRVRWPGVLALDVSSDQTSAVIYTRHDLGVCVEPVTDIPNSLNTGPHVIEPGTPLVATMRFGWREERIDA